MDSQEPSHTPRLRRIRDREKKRASRACDSCRRQKEKCDGGVPCRRCARLSRQCEFSAAGGSAERDAGSTSHSQLRNDIKRRTRSGETPSGQDKRLEYLERIVHSFTGNDTALDLDTLRNLAQSADKQRSSPGPTDASSQGSDFDGVDAKFSIEPIHENITHYSGEFSHWNFSMRVKNWIDQGASNDDPRQASRSVTKFKEYYRAEELQSPSSTLSPLSLLPPRSIADFLVHCFFKHAESNYFYVERDWLTANLDIAYDTATSFPRRDVGIVCMIFTILAIGTQYAYLESLADEGGDPMGEPGVSPKDSVGVIFYQQASRLIPDVITVSSLESVQACLLLGIYTLPVDASGLAYIYLNLAVKLAIQNGMHRKCSIDELGVKTCETRNRIWWTAYTIEKRVGIFHGRPTSIASTDVDAALPVDRSDLWPSTSVDHTAHILASLELNQKLSKLSHEISTLRTCPKGELDKSLGKLMKLHRELQEWWEKLPDALTCRRPTSLSEVSRRSLHLKLEHCLVRMFIGRAFILPQERIKGGLSPSDIFTETTSPPSGKRRLRSILVSDCVEAAMSVIDTCRTIRNSIGLARASYTEFSSCRASLLVIATQCLHKHGQTYRFRQALRDGLSMLKEMSASSESAHSEASLIEAFERAISKMDSTATGPGVASGAGVESEYARFKTWEQLWRNDASGLPVMGDGQDGQNGQRDEAESMAAENVEGLRGLDGELIPSATPFFGMEGTFASFPQSLDELSMFFGTGP